MSVDGIDISSVCPIVRGGVLRKPLFYMNAGSFQDLEVDLTVSEVQVRRTEKFEKYTVVWARQVSFV